MLLYLHIRNVALIEEAEIYFGRGLNILTGETGAGKSMIIDSVNFALGERAGRDFLRKGAVNASVELLFDNVPHNLQEKLVESGIPEEEDGTLLISRTYSDKGKSISRINGSAVTVGMLKNISETLIDLHGQHEHQSLLHPGKHIELLDRFCGSMMEEKKVELGRYFRQYQQIKKEMEDLCSDDRQRAQKIDLLQFQHDEIEQSGLTDGEEEDLQEKKKILRSADRLMKYAVSVVKNLYGTNGGSALDFTAQALDALGNLTEIDESLESVYEQLNDVYAQMEDAASQVRKYAREVESDPKKLEEVEERLNLIYNLKRKYGGSIREILSYDQKAVQELTRLKNSQEELIRLEEERSFLEKKINVICKSITELRTQKAKEVEKMIACQLHDLEMKHAEFCIQVEEKKEFTVNGKDAVEFLISANLGEELKPLAKIASGGEMSRVMLALKNVLADVDVIDTFIFDEIDTGVSGRAAQKVGEKMTALGQKRQVLCITHLPQIAAMADRHFLIEKNTADGRTITKVTALDWKASVQEVARLMGGAQITKATIAAAEEMKGMAETLKKSM